MLATSTMRPLSFIACAAARANLREADARLALARSTLERQTGLLKNGFVSGQAVDIAEAVCFLASDRAGFISGQKLDVDGGYSV